MYAKLNRAIQQGLKTLNEPARKVYAPGGEAIPVGHLLRNVGLADCLELIASDGLSAYYHGEIARRVSAFFASEGGLLAEDDFASVEAEELKPISTTYRGYTVWETPPVSQGLALLEALNIVEGYDLAALGWNQPETIHLMVEAKKIAYADRLRHAGDPRRVNIPLDRLLSKEYAEECRSRVDPMHATRVQPSLRELAQAGGDTTYVTAVDAEGNAVSLIQSLFNPFGSGVMAGDTGIMMNNRLFGFWLQPGHPNALEPGKRTMSTLNAFLLTRDGEYAMSGGTPGGDQQIQANLQMLADLIDFGMGPQQAAEATKWFHHPGTIEAEQAEPEALVIEPRVPVWVREELERRGHPVKLGPDWNTGSHKIIVRHPESGVYMAGASPARDGYAVAW
jgi:gamma-glutamyltranspeptidase/glutathione hydrolase